jgi:SAM-dependent methyltransferase
MFQHRTFNYDRVSGKRVLDIGCGRNKLTGALGLDCKAFAGVDVVSDLNKPLPFADEAFEVVHSNQVLEHVPNMVGLVEDIHRVLAPGGMMVACVPYFRSNWAAIDPTHVRQFTLNSLDYFVKGTYFFDMYRFSDTGYSRIERFLDTGYSASIPRWAFAALALRWPQRFENSALSFLYPFEALTFVLTK